MMFYVWIFFMILSPLILTLLIFCAGVYCILNIRSLGGMLCGCLVYLCSFVGLGGGDGGIQ